MRQVAEPAPERLFELPRPRGETGIERVTFVLRGDALEAFRRRLARY